MPKMIRVIVFVALFIALSSLALAETAPSVGVIGGADGPTAIFITQSDFGDPAARGVSETPPAAPYLQVDGYRGGQYFREYIALTEDDVAQALFNSVIYAPSDIGDFAITLVTDEATANETYLRNAALPAPFLEIAKERCGFTVASPEDIGTITAAVLTVSLGEGEATQAITDPEKLDRLAEILQGARPTHLGKCPYAGVLTMLMEDGTVLTLQKATDSCDGILFGTMRCFTIGKAENRAFWTMFDEVDAWLQGM